jgi:hypothetical protein
LNRLDQAGPAFFAGGDISAMPKCLGRLDAMIEKKFNHQNFFSPIIYYGKWVVFNTILTYYS